MEQAAEKNSVSVKIYNDTYTLRSSAPEADVLAVAGVVNDKMQQLAAGKNIQSRDKLAVWTALDLSADLFELKKRYNHLQNEHKIDIARVQNEARDQYARLENLAKQKIEQLIAQAAAAEQQQGSAKEELEKALQAEKQKSAELENKLQERCAELESQLRQLMERYDRLAAAIRER